MDNFTASYQGHQGAWRGVLKCNGDVVWVCRHLHHNRDQSSRSNGQSAVGCASAELLQRRMEAQGLKSRLSIYGGVVWS
jgi:hypothetical protein